MSRTCHVRGCRGRVKFLNEDNDGHACRRHRKGGEDCVSERCAVINCRSWASYNYPLGRPLFCSTHRTVDMVNCKVHFRKTVCMCIGCDSQAMPSIPLCRSHYKIKYTRMKWPKVQECNLVQFYEEQQQICQARYATVLQNIYYDNPGLKNEEPTIADDTSNTSVFEFITLPKLIDFDNSLD